MIVPPPGEQDICHNKSVLEYGTLWSALACAAVLFIYAIFTAYSVLCKQEPSQRPHKVKLSITLVSLQSFFAGTYFILQLVHLSHKRNPSIQYFWENLIITFANIFTFLNDMLFFDQYLSTALLIPFVLDPSITQKAQK